MFSAGFSNNPELSSFGAYYQPSFDHHIIIVRFFKNQGGGMSFEPSSFNTFLSDIEHELTHFSQAKELLFKTDSDGNLLHDRETFKTKLDSYLKANKDRAKEFKIKDVDEALDLVAKMEGLNLSPSMRSSLRPDIEKMILNDEPSLWDRNDPREPSAHIQDILRQLKPPTENDLSSSENFMSYVNKSEAFKTYMLSVKDVRVKKSLLKSLYYAVNLKKDDPTAFKISEKDEDTLFPEVAKAYEDLYKKPEPMKSMQPMKAKKKK
jgi:hypothetical protein